MDKRSDSSIPQCKKEKPSETDGITKHSDICPAMKHHLNGSPVYTVPVFSHTLLHMRIICFAFPRRFRFCSADPWADGSLAALHIPCSMSAHFSNTDEFTLQITQRFACKSGHCERFLQRYLRHMLTAFQIMGEYPWSARDPPKHRRPIMTASQPVSFSIRLASSPLRTSPFPITGMDTASFTFLI